MKRNWIVLLLVLITVLVSCPDPVKPLPKIISFTATPNTLTAAGDVKLEWKVENATEVSISPDIGVVNGTSKTLNVSSSKTFTLTAKNTAGVDTRSLDVTLNPLPTSGPYVQITAPNPTQPNKVATIPVAIVNGYGVYQGDILFDPSDIQNSTSPKRDTRGNRLEPGYCENGAWFWKYNCHELWANKTLFYEFGAGLPVALQNVIQKAATVFQDRAGIRLVYATSGDRVLIKTIPASDPRGGSSFVGRKGGVQDMEFQADADLATVLHEFGHALGLWHEQGRADRNNYIRILENNILSEQLSQYRLIDDPDIGHPDGPYDFYSIMHYRALKSSFAKKDGAGNRLPTFELVNPTSGINLEQVGNADTLSAGDVLALANLYDAPVTAGSIQLLKVGSNKLMNGGQTSVNIRVQNDGPRALKDLYFSISAPIGISLTNTSTNLTCNNAGANLLSCYAPTGPTVGGNSVFGPIKVTVAPDLPTGKLEIVLELRPIGTRLADAKKSVSRLQIENIRIDPDVFEVNDSFETATNLKIFNIYDGLNFSLTLHTLGDTDYFLFDASDVTKNKSYEFTGLNLDGGVDSYLEIFDENKIQIPADITKPGKYYLKISGNQIMRYNFLITVYDPEFRAKLRKYLGNLPSAPLVFRPGGLVEKNLILKADYFQVGSSIRQVLAQGANIQVGLYNQNLELRAQTIVPAAGTFRIDVPPANIGELLFVKLERAQNEVMVDNLTILQPLSAYTISGCNTRAVQCSADTTPPTVSLSRNSNGSILSAQVVQFTADAQDNDAVKTVEFYEDDILIGSDETAPYTQNVSFSSLHNGLHSYVARAIDFAGNENKTQALNIGVDITNNIFNPGAEAGEGASASSPAVSSIPGWTVSNAASVIKYGSDLFPAANIAQAIGGETQFFSGGTQDSASLEQVINVAGGWSAIDAGKVSFTLSAYLGGNSNQEDNAKVSVTFLDATGAVITGDPTSPQIGPVTANDRNVSTILVQKETSGAVPANTRAIRVTITMSKFSSDSSNDGYADNIKLGLYTQ